MTTNTSKITGRTALTLAEAFNLELHKHADPTEGARDGLTVAEAREIAREDARLVWVDAEDLPDAAIRGLRSDAAAAGNLGQVSLCDVALGLQERACVETDDDEVPVVSVDRGQARVMCARAIADKAARS